MAISWILSNTHLSVMRLHWLYLVAQHTVVCLDQGECQIVSLDVRGAFDSGVACQASFEYWDE